MQVHIYYHLSISSCVLWICGLLVFGFVDLFLDLFFISLSQSHASSDLLSYLYFRLCTLDLCVLFVLSDL